MRGKKLEVEKLRWSLVASLHSDRISPRVNVLTFYLLNTTHILRSNSSNQGRHR